MRPNLCPRVAHQLFYLSPGCDEESRLHDRSLQALHPVTPRGGYRYDPVGNRLKKMVDADNRPLEEGNHRWESESHRARYYYLGIGRFITKYLIGLAGGYTAMRKIIPLFGMNH